MLLGSGDVMLKHPDNHIEQELGKRSKHRMCVSCFLRNSCSCSLLYLYPAKTRLGAPLDARGTGTGPSISRDYSTRVRSPQHGPQEGVVFLLIHITKKTHHKKDKYYGVYIKKSNKKSFSEFGSRKSACVLCPVCLLWLWVPLCLLCHHLCTT